MPLDEDRYPKETGRRRFVTGIVGTAALAGLTAGGAAAVDTLTDPAGEGGGTVEFVGVENIDGPAPRGMPIIPIEIQDGQLTGVWPEYSPEKNAAVAPDFGGSGIPYSSAWFQYCGIQTAPGVRPQADQDNTFRSSPGTYDWQNDVEEGAPLTVDMFDDYESWGNGIGKSGLGKPASGTWRSEGDVETMPIELIRSDRVTRMANGEGEYSDLPGDVRQFMSAATDQGFIAWLNKCTHFCCIPGWKAEAVSASFGAENDIYCPCHQSVYDPFSPVVTQFVALPRPPAGESGE